MNAIFFCLDIFFSVLNMSNILFQELNYESDLFVNLVWSL